MKLTPWIFIGAILVIYGFIIAMAGIYYWLYPVNTNEIVYHLDFWWGILMLVVGSIFLKIAKN